MFTAGEGDARGIEIEGAGSVGDLGRTWPSGGGFASSSGSGGVVF